jgi:hypothetical protein
VEVATEQHVVEHAQLCKDPQVLKGPSDAEACDLVRLATHDVAAFELDLTVLGCVQPADRIQQARLAGAVGTDNGSDFARSYLERDIRESLDTSERQAEVMNCERRERSKSSVHATALRLPR